MKSFLSEVAEQLYGKYGNSLSDVNILFPSQRARLFFSEALVDIAQRPIWAPRYTTIDELMGQISNLRSADRLRLISELYGVYSKYHQEDFDRFYHWGEMLVADFDMIDKYCVNAQLLFTNIADLKQIDADIDYLQELTPDQKQCLNQFWNILNTQRSLSEHKEQFLKIWRSLHNIYSEYKERLRSLGIGYTGMIYRDAAERIKCADTLLLPEQNYVIAGFNALSGCEKVLFDYLKTAHNADFFWDYSDYYLSPEQEAGRFIRENISRYPSALPISHQDLRSNISTLTVASTTTSVAQCKYVVEILKQIAGVDKNGHIGHLERDTAIVLTDEGLLLPLLYSLPKELKNGSKSESVGVNVTMGYSVRQSVAYSFVERLLELQNHARHSEQGDTFYYADVDGILTHPYLQHSDTKVITELRTQIVKEHIYNVPASMLAELPFAKDIFVHTSTAEQLMEYVDDVLCMVVQSIGAADVLQTEFLLHIRQSLLQLKNMVDNCQIELTQGLCRSLIRRHLQTVRVPFEGEPLEGLQIMGILETRNLDFKNVIVLSMSDNNFPGNRITDSSFIPYNLRFAYGLPTKEHHEGVYAYYFYRLIERAENVWLLYSSLADEKGSGEPSRYIRQLEFESGLKINFQKVGVEINVKHSEEFSVAKDERAFVLLDRYTTGEVALSPTALSTYVKCPMKFFYKYIANIKEEDKLEENLDDRGFGNIFHSAAEFLYTDIIGNAAPKDALERISDNDIVESVDRAISHICYNKKPLTDSMLKGEIGIVRQIIIKYLKEHLLRYDIAHSNFSVMALEQDFDCTFDFESAGIKRKVLLKGRADRVDSLNNGIVRIIDYKTGGEHLVYKDFDKLFNGSDADRVSNTINTLMYAMIATRKFGRQIQPALYYLRNMHNYDYSPLLYRTEGRVPNKQTIYIEKYSDIAEEFEAQIRATLASMYDPQVPFSQAKDSHACIYCEYKPICARKVRKVD